LACPQSSQRHNEEWYEQYAREAGLKEPPPRLRIVEEEIEQVGEDHAVPEAKHYGVGFFFRWVPLGEDKSPEEELTEFCKEVARRGMWPIGAAMIKSKDGDVYQPDPDSIKWLNSILLEERRRDYELRHGED
jgi:hypothetical protein